jgi:hypothetical protein
LSEGFEWLQAAPKSWFRARVENGLQRGKLWWLPMVGGHRSVAKGVGERAKQPEGLYLGCRPRYSCLKRLPGWASWLRCLFDKKNEVMCDCVRWEMMSESAWSFSRYSSSYNILRKKSLNFFICLSQIEFNSTNIKQICVHVACCECC